VAGDGGGIDRDIEIQRNQNVTDAGVGAHELERPLGCTPEQLEFQVWYMKEDWITKDNGY
jgi:hypothetical protein